MTMVAATMLTGCGSKKKDSNVTAEELLNGVKETAEKGGKYNDMDMTFDIAGKIDVAALMGGASEDGEPALMEAGVNGTMNVKADEDTTATEGTVNVKMMGMEQAQDAKSWNQDNGDGTETDYDFDTDSNTWTYTVSEVEEEASKGDASKDSVKDIVDSIKDCKVESTKDGYTITGTLDMDKIMNASKDTDVADTVDQYKDYADKLKVSVEIHFDKDKNLKDVNLKADKVEDESFVLEKAEISIKVNSLAGTDSLDVPDDVKSNAVEAQGF